MEETRRDRAGFGSGLCVLWSVGELSEDGLEVIQASERFGIRLGLGRDLGRDQKKSGHPALCRMTAQPIRQDF